MGGLRRRSSRRVSRRTRRGGQRTRTYRRSAKRANGGFYV